MKFRWLIVCCLYVVMVMLSGPAVAQNLSSASINGTVTDPSGAALPGVTVTVSGSALEVGKRTTVTDSEGVYRLRDLPAGTYDLRFEVTGFQPEERTGLVLPADFAARVDASLKIGSSEQTITVSGESPVVDTTTTASGENIPTSLIDTDLPANRIYSDLLEMTPGLVATAGEDAAVLGLNGRPRFTDYGLASSNNNASNMVDGFIVIVNSPTQNVDVAQEVDIKTYGNTAEIKEPGPVINQIIKSGGDTFHGDLSETYMRQPSGNLTPYLMARGLTVGKNTTYFNDAGADLGGRIIRKKLWFYGAYRYRNTIQSQTGLVYASNGLPANPYLWARNFTGKVSYQINDKYQAMVYLDRDQTWNAADEQIAPFGATVNFIHTPFESTNIFNWNFYTQKGELRGTPSNKLIFDAQFGRSWYYLVYGDQPQSAGEVTTYNATTLEIGGSNIPHISYPYQWVGQVDATYSATSHHSLKVGWFLRDADNQNGRPINPAGNYALEYATVLGVPNTPLEFESNNAPVNRPQNWDKAWSVYATDQWTLSKRLTLNYGLRFDRQHSYVPAQSRPAGDFVAAASFPFVNVGTWNNVAPRAAFAWDVTGNGKTVVKGTYGWYNLSNDISGTYNQYTSYTTDYKWHAPASPAGAGYCTGCPALTPYAPGEVDLSTTGPDFLSTTNVANTILNNSLKMTYMQEMTGSFEREIKPGLAVRGLYTYYRFGDQFSSINVLRPYADYTVGTTRILPTTSGTIVAGGPTVVVWDYPTQFKGSTFVGNENENRPAGREDFYQSVEGSLNKRFANKWSILTSFTATKLHQWVVSIPLSPNDLYYPINTNWTWSAKMNGTYNLPHQIVLGAIVDVENGYQGQGTATFLSNSPTDGPAFPSSSTITIRTTPVGGFGGSLTTAPIPTVDFRIGKKLTLEKGEFTFSVDVINVGNSSAVRTATYVYGSSFGFVSDEVPPRLIRGGVSFKF